MKATWRDIVVRVLRSAGCWLAAAFLMWRGWTMNDPQGTESILCCFTAFTLLVTGIAVGVGVDGEPQMHADERR